VGKEVGCGERKGWEVGWGWNRGGGGLDQKKRAGGTGLRGKGNMWGGRGRGWGE